MNKAAYLIISCAIIFIATIINYSMVDPNRDDGARRHSGGIVILPSGGGFSSGSHK